MDKENIIEIPYASALYPAEWKALSDAPKTLYALGNTQLLTARKFTVVGSRTTPAGALKLAQTLAKQLSAVFAIATGTADGGDTAAIEGALQGSGKVICILAGGFSALPQNKLTLLKKVIENGLLLSPYPYGEEVRKYSYEYRNKLLALLGEGTLVVGASQKSGALITARYAYRAKKKLFAFPYAPNTETGAGCNAILKNGGFLTENAEDIFQKFGIESTQEKMVIELTQEEEKLLLALKTLTEGHISELSAKAGVPVFKARTLLSALEVKGVAVHLGGNRYAPV